MNQEIQVGDVVQIDPAHDETFAACFMVVTEVRDWGVIGRFPIPHRDGPGQAYYRCAFEHLARIGRAEWIPADEEVATASE